MAVHHWDPATCESDLLGELRGIIVELQAGESIELPDGAFVDVNEDGFFAGKGETATQITDPSGVLAAKAALEQSNYDSQLAADPHTEEYDDLGDNGRLMLSKPGIEKVLRLSAEDGEWLERQTVGSFDELVRVNGNLQRVWTPLTRPKFAVYTDEMAPGVTFEVLIGEIDTGFWGAVATVLDLSGVKVEGVDCAVRMAVDVTEQAVIEEFESMLDQLQETYYTEMTGSSPEQPVEEEEVELAHEGTLYDPFAEMSIEEIAIQLTKLPFVDYVDLADGGVMLHFVNGYFVHLAPVEGDGTWQAFTEIVEDGERVPIGYYKPTILEALSALLADKDANLLSGTEFGKQVQNPLSRNVRFRDELSKETEMPVWSFDLFSLPTKPMAPEIYADNGYTMILLLTNELVYDVTVRSWDGRLNETQRGLVVEEVNELVDFFKAKGLDETPTGD